MAEEEEERAVEMELELQLHDQRDSLASLTQALLADPSNSELLSVSEQVAEAIKEAEEGLFQLKRARLLREIDSKLVAKDFIVEASGDPSNAEFVVGSKCRFRHSDGRWHNSLVLSLSGSGSAKISFLTPTSQNMLMCKFYLQGRCRYGTSCRSFHGIDVPISSLKKYTPTVWDESLVGSSVLAVTDDVKGGLWREAELESWDDALGRARVIFRDDGSSASLMAEAVTLPEYTGETTDEEEGISSGESCSSDSDDEEGSLGLGFPALPRGIQKGTAIFAKWENHTRGIASKMMANMGYRAGMGLGASGQGMVDPIPVRVLLAKQSLDHAVETPAGEKGEEGREGKKKRQSRGGKRKRDKKFAVLARARKEKEDKEAAPDVFSIINHQLVRHDEARNGVSGKKIQKQRRDGESVDGERVDRRRLVESNHEMKGLRTKVEKLEEMAKRNRGEKVVYEAAMRKLVETRTALANAEAAHASASNQVSSREKEKKWLKF